MFSSSESAINILNDLLQYEHIEADEENGVGGQLSDALMTQSNLTFYIDIYRIEQVIRNLITNAMKFTPRDGEVRVGISCELFNSTTLVAMGDKFGKDAVGCLRVEVSDSGVGLTAEEQRNLFGEFTQYNKNELQAG
eukprot:gene69251-biopygen6297